ncbi:MAG: glycerol-3-phosphate 1-O-acyltransferase PlsY [Pseudomonadota bacterium]
MPTLETSLPFLALWALVGYTLGSIPFGVVFARIMGLGNLREIGSGNIGATNVLRTGNKTAAALTLVFDAGKGAFAVLLARLLASEDAAQITALTAMLGHCYPIWLRFSGGKGVATFLGLLWALSWPIGLSCCLIWLIAAAISRMSSFAALTSAAMSAPIMLILGQAQGTILCLLLTVIIFWRHQDNIRRIRNGHEPRIGQKSNEM